MAMLAKFVFFAGMALPVSIPFSKPLHAQTIGGRLAEHIRAAQQAEAHQDFANAVHEYQIIAKDLPGRAEIQSNLGMALYLNQELRLAIDSFQKAIALNPNLLTPHLFSGLAWYRLSQPDAAVPELEKATRMKPDDVIAHMWLGYAHAAQSQYDAAIDQFQTVCRLAPGNVDAWYSLGQTYLQRGKQATTDLLALTPDGARVWQLAGEQFQLRGDTKAALEDFTAANKRRPDIPELRILVAELGGHPVTVGATPVIHNREDVFYHQAHESEQDAREALEHLAQIAPDSYRAHQIQADLFLSEQQLDQSIAEYRTVLNLNPDLPGIHEAIGNIFLQNGNLRDALKEFDAELQIQPDSAVANMDAGKVYLLLGGDDTAAKMLTYALQKDRPPLETYLLLGKLAMRRGDPNSAISLLNRYISVDQGNSDAYYLLARAYKLAGNKEQMNLALRSFAKTSSDVKSRNSAQKELESRDKIRSASLDTEDGNVGMTAGPESP